MSRRLLISNFFSLSIIQGINYVFPLLTIPYLVKVLGPDRFGLIAYAQALMQYFVVVNDYGFNLSATRKIATIRHDSTLLGRTVSSILLLKAIFIAASLIVLLLLCLLIPRFRQEILLYLISFGFVAGNSFIPLWFFQGAEKMQHIAIASFVGRLFYFIVLFSLVRGPADYLLAAGVYSLAQVIVAITGIFLVLIVYKVKLVLPARRDMVIELKEGWNVFVSMVASNLYTSSNAFILGFFASNAVVGYYSAGEKIVRTIQAMMNPVFQSVFPHLSALAAVSRDRALLLVKKIALLVGSVTFVISLLLFVGAVSIVSFLFGPAYERSVSVIRILAFLPFICSMGNIFGTQIMLNFNLEKPFKNIIVAGAFLNVVLALFLVNVLSYHGIAISMLITESFITIALLLYLANNFPITLVIGKTLACSDLERQQEPHDYLPGM